MKAEISVMFLQVKKPQRLLANYEKLGGRHGTDSPSESPEGTNFANTMNLNFKHPELQDNKFLLLQPPSLWFFVMSALAKRTPTALPIAVSLAVTKMNPWAARNPSPLGPSHQILISTQSVHPTPLTLPIYPPFHWAWETSNMLYPSTECSSHFLALTIPVLPQEELLSGSRHFIKWRLVCHSCLS